MAPFESKSVNVNGPRRSRRSTVGKPDYNVANAFQGFDDALEANDPKGRKEKLAAKRSRKSLGDGKPLDLRSEAVSAVRVSGLKPMLLVDVLDHHPWTDYVDFVDQDDDLPASSTASSRKRPRPATRGQPSTCNVQADDRFGLDAPPNPLKTYGQDQGLQEPISPGRSSDTDLHAGRQESQGQGQGHRDLPGLEDEKAEDDEDEDDDHREWFKEDDDDYDENNDAPHLFTRCRTLTRPRSRTTHLPARVGPSDIKMTTQITSPWSTPSPMSSNRSVPTADTHPPNDFTTKQTLPDVFSCADGPLFRTGSHIQLRYHWPNSHGASYAPQPVCV